MRNLAGILLVLVSGVASAQTYVDGNVGLNTWNDNLAFSVDGGFMFNPYVGAEVGLTGTSGYTMFDIAAKGVLAMGDVVGLYGKLGLGIPTCGYCDSGVYYGAGVNFNLSKQWQLHVEDYSVTGAANPNFLMFGAHLNF